MRTSVTRVLVLLSVLGLLFAALCTAPAAAAAEGTDTTIDKIDIDAATIPELQAFMDQHKLTSAGLTEFYLHRIENLNHVLNAVIVISPTAMSDAQAADAARTNGSKLPLLGIPVLVKDNINTTGMPTTAGSWALRGSSPADAFIVGRLRRAGAVILGKANLSEWANFRSGPSSSGWSGIGGQTNMPYVLDRNPCGSSSGSAVAAAADLATVTVGTETDGSIVCPSGASGDVGIKPTLGLLSRAGIIPVSADQDTAGPITRNTTDAAVMLGVMTAIDPHDPATAGQAGHAYVDYTQFLDANALAGARIGVWREGTYDPKANPEVETILNQALVVLRAKGATVIDNLRVPIEPAYDPEFTALLCEFKTDIETYLRQHTAARYPKTLKALIDFNRLHPDLEGPWNSDVFDAAQATGGRGDRECTTARRIATSTARSSLDDLMARYDLDAIVAPTNGPAWVTDPKNGDDFSTFVGSSSPSAIAGYPAVAVPAGLAGGLPIGVSFMGTKWDEPELIALAFAFEQAGHARVPPSFVATTSPTKPPLAMHGNPELAHSSVGAVMP